MSANAVIRAGFFQSGNSRPEVVTMADVSNERVEEEVIRPLSKLVETTSKIPNENNMKAKENLFEALKSIKAITNADMAKTHISQPEDNEVNSPSSPRSSF